MNNTFAFLSALNQQGIKLWVADEQLRVNAPQGALTAELTAQLKARKAEIVAFLQQHQAATQVASIQPAPRTQPLPLSFSQQRLWFLEQLGSGATYTLPAAFKLEGSLNVPALEQSLSEIVRRHESLRTTFAQDGGQTQQVIHAPTPVALPVIDLRPLPAAEQATAVQRLTRQETLRPFDLTSDLMLRATLLRLGSPTVTTNHESHSHVLLLTLHHIAADGWSMGVLVRELVALYEAFAHGKAASLAPLSIQYADFAVWQRNWLQGETLEKQLTYWKTQLAGAPELLHLPTDFPRPPVQTFRASKVDFQIDADLTQPLRQLSQQAGATLFMTLLAAFQVLLARYSGQDDIVVDAPIANRTQPALEPLIGFFVNDLALRANLAGNPTFLDLLAQVRQTTQRAYEHQDLPFDRLVEALQPQRNLGYNPVTQVVFALQNTPTTAFDLSGLQVQPVDLEVQQTRMDVEVHLWERSDGLHGSWIYNTDLFAAATIERMIGHFQTLLAGIVADPQQCIADLPLLTATERQQILVDWNATQADTPHQSLHQLFEAQAARTPDAVAVIFAEDKVTNSLSQPVTLSPPHPVTLSYAELNARANQLAHFLQTQGVGPETLVGLCVDRSLEMVVGMLGILKAGGAYVPLDPAYPADRIAFIVAETQTPVLLTQAHLLATLPEHGARIIALDSDWPTIAQFPTTNPTSAVAPHHLAYVIYTSGSTGKPKGVLIEQASVAAHCTQYQRFYALTPADRVLQLASFHFDASVEQIFPALLTGASVVVPEWDLAPLNFSQNLQRYGITLLDLAGAHLRLLLQEWIKNPALIAGSPLRIVVAGADVMPVDLIPLWRQTRLAQTARLFNVYGPTETTVAATIFEITDAFDAARPRIPIGRPLANKQLYILDPQRQPVPIGVPGELYIGGVGPARGYLQRPELTKEKFISSYELRVTSYEDEDEAHDATRKSKIVNRKLYKTGDLVRWLPDGNIDFLGRIDQQVKIRSFRVELGEIEAVLQQHPALQEVAVLAREDERGQKRLVAYLTPQLPDSFIPELRTHLKKHLPEYMLPDAFVMLADLPKTPIGVLDRRALPAPDLMQSAVPYVPPGSAAEQKITAIWEAVLKRNGISIHDNFFDVGGHSLLAIEVHSLLRPDYPTLQMVDLFSYPTIHTLAGYLEQSSVVQTGTNRTQQQTTAEERGAQRRTRQPAATAGAGIAIIGLAGRFPHAPDLAAFWALLQAGSEAVVTFSEEELLAAGVDPALLQCPQYVKAGTIVPDVEYFDADFFKFSALDARLTDPQHRLLMECAWQAMEQAGYPAAKTAARIGLYVGAGENSYQRHYLDPNRATLTAAVGEYRLAMLNSADFLATHTAYKLNLTGPAMTVQTACSTSLVAVHVACQSLLNFECDLALAGGVSLFLPQGRGYLYQEGMILSPDGHCRAFDAGAQGTTGGGGVGVVMLKRLAEALADGDTIHAVILGSAVNNDGADKIGFTAPSVNGQSAVIVEAQAAAGVHPDAISYIEAHGTGTPLGDPIEIEALTQAFRGQTLRKGYCAIGSVKTNIGHADVAAGVAGLIKTVLALKHRQLPPSLHFSTPNPQIDFASSPFFVNDRLRDWTVTGGERRCAGVSAFGIGGTNAHVVVAEAPAVHPLIQTAEQPWHLLRLSAKTPSALEKASQNLAQHLQRETDLDLADVAYTLQVGRQDFDHRQIVVCRDRQEAATLLACRDPQRVLYQQAGETAPALVFMFPGGGAQYPNMGRALYESDLAALAPYRAAIDQCLDILHARFQIDLQPLLFPHDDHLAEAQVRLEQPSLAYPALFATEYALAQVWLSWGIAPTAMIGHSMGEYIAACLAGVFSLEDALSIVTWRGQLYETIEPGAMLSVYLSEAELQPYLSGELAIAAINKQNLCTVSGPVAALEQLADTLTKADVAWRRVKIAFAGHSPLQEPILPEFRRRLQQVRFAPPTLPFVSNVTGTWIRPEEAMDPDYWVRHLRQTVRFTAGLSELLRQPNRLFLEVGPGQTLQPLVQAHPDKQKSHAALSTMRHPKAELSDIQHLLQSVGQLWLNGVAVDALMVDQRATRRRIPLPTYPFARQRHWVDAPQPVMQRAAPLIEAAARPVSTGVLTASAENAPATNRRLSPLEAEIATVWAQSLGLPSIAAEADFFALGGDSLLATQVMARLRSQLQVELDTHSLLQAPTIARLATLIAARRAQPENATRLPTLVVELQAGDPTRKPLVLFHPVGGHVYFYRQLVRHLDPQLPVYGIRAQGVEGEAEPLTSVAEMAQVYTTALQALQPEGPYYLAGASFGGTLAYAIAQQLLAQGETVAFLGLIDTPSQGHMPEPFAETVDILFYMLKVGEAAEIAVETLRAMDEEQQLAFFLQQSRSTFATTHELKIMLKLFQANERAMWHYAPPPYPGKLHYFLARERDAFTAQTPAQGWIGLAEQGIAIYTVPGNHISMNEEPQVQQLAKRLEQSLSSREVVKSRRPASV
jgi:amino acid adenylation domain-containing protein